MVDTVIQYNCNHPIFICKAVLSKKGHSLMTSINYKDIPQTTTNNYVSTITLK